MSHNKAQQGRSEYSGKKAPRQKCIHTLSTEVAGHKSPRHSWQMSIVAPFPLPSFLFCSILSRFVLAGGAGPPSQQVQAFVQRGLSGSTARTQLLGRGDGAAHTAAPDPRAGTLPERERSPKGGTKREGKAQRTRQVPRGSGDSSRAEGQGPSSAGQVGTRQGWLIPIN